MKAGFISQRKEGIVKARAVEDRLMRDSWQIDSYDLLPKLRTLSIPTLVMLATAISSLPRFRCILRERYHTRASLRSRTADNSHFSNVAATFSARSTTSFAPGQGGRRH